ncbi:MAG: carbohydrate kinase family protein [candidate division Zixibacteria bacterium]|nr:carbohydrate kinase family protein [candidate division Zixibacteria bacterium]
MSVPVRVSRAKPGRIAIVGSINRDEVWTEQGQHRRGWGGILYNVAALAQHLPAQATVLPIARLGRDAQRPVGRWLQTLRQVDTSGLLPMARVGNLCEMRYKNADERHERLLHRVPPLKYSDLRPALTAELILVNFISGNDITIGALERLRRDYRGLIYMDIHSYLLGRHHDATRFARRPTGWRRILPCADVLQMNEVEFATLSGQTASSESVLKWTNEIIASMKCRCVMVTLGALGSYCLTRWKGRWRLRHFPSGHRPRGADPTGCGDTFSGLWIASWVRSSNLLECARIATAGAARPIRPMA